MTVQEGVLAWPFIPACDLVADYPTLTGQQRSEAVDAAVEWVWSHTGRQFGTRAVVLRPQTRSRGVSLEIGRAHV